MGEFNYKKFLTENKLTHSSREVSNNKKPSDNFINYMGYAQQRTLFTSLSYNIPDKTRRYRERSEVRNSHGQDHARFSGSEWSPDRLPQLDREMPSSRKRVGRPEIVSGSYGDQAGDAKSQQALGQHSHPAYERSVRIVKILCNSQADLIE